MNDLELEVFEELEVLSVLTLEKFEVLQVFEILEALEVLAVLEVLSDLTFEGFGVLSSVQFSICWYFMAASACGKCLFRLGYPSVLSAL